MHVEGNAPEDLKLAKALSDVSYLDEGFHSAASLACG